LSSSSPSTTARGKQKSCPSTPTDRSIVLEALQGIINSGLAFRKARSKRHQFKLYLLGGEVFILDKVGIKRVL
jgi:hypothetical protein